MAHTSPQFVEFITEQLSELPGLASARLFGGIGFSAHGTQFGMVIGPTLYFVVDDLTRPRYEELGSQCFAYDTKVRRVQVKRYFEVPADIIEDRGSLFDWALQAVRAAREPAAKKKARGSLTARAARD